MILKEFWMEKIILVKGSPGMGNWAQLTLDWIYLIQKLLQVSPIWILYRLFI